MLRKNLMLEIVRKLYNWLQPWNYLNCLILCIGLWAVLSFKENHVPWIFFYWIVWYVTIYLVWWLQVISYNSIRLSSFQLRKKFKVQSFLGQNDFFSLFCDKWYQFFRSFKKTVHSFPSPVRISPSLPSTVFIENWEKKVWSLQLTGKKTPAAQKSIFFLRWQIIKYIWSKTAVAADTTPSALPLAWQAVTVKSHRCFKLPDPAFIDDLGIITIILVLLTGLFCFKPTSYKCIQCQQN